MTLITQPPAVDTQQHGPKSARHLLVAYYAGLGVVMAVWGARMPAVQATAHLSAGRLALVLLAAAFGVVAALQVGGRLVHHYGAARLLVGPAVLLGSALVALGWCRSLPALITTAWIFGIAHGLFDIATNASAVRCQEAYGRPIMSGFHAAYSLGGLAGAVLAVATARLPHELLFTGMGAMAVVTALASGWMTHSVGELDKTASVKAAAAGPQNGPRPRVWLLGAIAAACLLGEGAAADWAAVHLHTLQASATVAAGAYAVYSAAMAAGRLTGDRLTVRYGSAPLICTGAGLAAAGLGLGVAVGTVPAALMGWGLFGLGLSTVVPAAVTAAGRGGPRAVASVAAVGYLGMLAGPAVIGALTSVSSLPAALFLPVALAGAVAVVSHRALNPTQ
ncbi:MFS transporter [Streptomyces sp. NPDC020707]|uniref:MFS transporter n=1 Tax=Streptomyces sp. NPDC020707 TaxID=3365084 RepID=UPI00378FB04A